MKKKQFQQNELPSRVLLVCVYDTIVIELTNEVIYARFAPFGHIIKILIFERGEVTKFFIEFAFEHQAQQAKIVLDGSKLFEAICKMNIYYSNFRSVDLKHQTTEGICIDPLVSMTAGTFVPVYEPLAYFQPYDYQYQDTYFQPLLGITAHSNIPYENYSLPNYSGAQIRTYSGSPSSANIKQRDADQVQSFIESEVDWLLRSQQKKSEITGVSNGQVELVSKQKTDCYLTFGIVRDTPNRQTYNLFSNFGNISFIKKTKNNIYIKYRTAEFAAIASNYLQGFYFNNNCINFLQLDDLAQAQPKEDQYAQINYYDSSFDRFTAKKSITINPPSKTLHVSSLRREVCKTDNLIDIFQQFGPVEGVQILNHSNERSMALVQFQHIQSSFSAMAEMHDCPLSGKKIQISFTKSKIY